MPERIERRKTNQQDHDLLIEINTKLGRVIDDVKELKDNVATRVTDLEEHKVDKLEFDKLAAEQKKDREFIDNLKGKYAIVSIVAGVAIAAITAWITKHI